jgi:plastocyanin
MEEEVEAAPMSAEVSIPSGSSLPGCEETNECYIPYVVTISVGGTVTWTNDDTAAHTVTSETVTSGPDGIFDSSIVMAGKTFEHTFDDAGTYDYFCVVHPWMTGQVVVE